MEEEANRIAQGQVPEMDSFVMTQKDAPPPSFNAIFNPPENYVGDRTPSPAARLTPPAPSVTGTEAPDGSNGVEGNQTPPPGALPPSASPRQEGEELGSEKGDYDSDEGIAVEKGDLEDDDDEEVVAAPDRLPEALDEGNPTDEEVDAVLAEIDSIPDDAGDVDDDDEDEEGWSYFKMEPQKQPQNEELICASEVPVDTLPVSDIVPPKSVTPENAPVSRENSPTGSPPAPSSPRTVEGFVTSVELNTPEESYNTNLAINQSTEYFNGGQIEQSSGPFSVYVSSSPEPASIESPPVNLHSPIEPAKSPVEMEGKVDEEVKSNASIEEEKGPSVEIVHAQSTVEVMTDIPTEVEFPSDMALENKNINIPDIMTQSFTGDLPTEPYENRSFLEDKEPSLEEQIEKFPEPMKPEILEKEVVQDLVDYRESVSPIEPSIETQGEKITKFNDEPTPDAHYPLQETDADDLEKSSIGVSEEFNVAASPVSSEQIQSPQPPVEEISNVKLVEELEEKVSVEPEPEPETVELLDNTQEEKFAQEINKPFEAPLDHMMTSFHEDLSQPKEPEPNVELQDSPKEKPVEKVEAVIESLSNEIEEMKIEDKPVESPQETDVPKPEISVSPIQETLETPVASKTEPKRPTSVPRTSVSKTAPPKPSPRSVGSKLSTSKTATATTPTSQPASAKATPKRPSSLTTSQKPLRKVESTKPTTSAVKSRLTTTTTTATSGRTSLSSRTSSAAPKTSATSTLKSRTATTTTSSAKPKTTTSTSMPKVSSTSTLKSKSNPVSSTAKRVTATPKSTLSTTAPKTGTISKIPNGTTTTSKPSTKPTTRPSSLNPPKRPMSAKTTNTTSSTTASTRISSAPANRKPLSTTSTSSSTIRQKSATSTATKDTKNSTNRMLSTSRTSAVKSSVQATTKSTLPATRTRPATKTTKTSTLKSDKEKKMTPKSTHDDSVANGENKIIDEESSVEVKEKIMAEEQIIETSSKTEEIVTVNQETVLVNGDH